MKYGSKHNHKNIHTEQTLKIQTRSVIHIKDGGQTKSAELKDVQMNKRVMHTVQKACDKGGYEVESHTTTITLWNRSETKARSNFYRN